MREVEVAHHQEDLEGEVEAEVEEELEEEARGGGDHKGQRYRVNIILTPMLTPY